MDLYIFTPEKSGIDPTVDSFIDKLDGVNRRLHKISASFYHMDREHQKRSGKGEKITFTYDTLEGADIEALVNRFKSTIQQFNPNVVEIPNYEIEFNNISQRLSVPDWVGYLVKYATIDQLPELMRRFALPVKNIEIVTKKNGGIRARDMRSIWQYKIIRIMHDGHYDIISKLYMEDLRIYYLNMFDIELAYRGFCGVRTIFHRIGNGTAGDRESALIKEEQPYIKWNVMMKSSSNPDDRDLCKHNLNGIVTGGLFSILTFFK